MRTAWANQPRPRTGAGFNRGLAAGRKTYHRPAVEQERAAKLAGRMSDRAYGIKVGRGCPGLEAGCLARLLLDTEANCQVRSD